MIRDQVKFFIRIFLKDKFFSVLNILGLALGIAVSIILLLNLQNDLTYDHYNKNYKRIYRLSCHLQGTGVDHQRARTARELGQILRLEFPEILNVVRANNWDHTLVQREVNGEKKAFYEEDIVRTDSSYFQVFTGEFIKGDPSSCLRDPFTTVITESIAKKYFGNEDPVDKTLIIDDAVWKVTAVIKDLPENTHLKFNILLSRLVERGWLLKDGQVTSEAFWNPDVYTYLLVPANYKPEDFLEKFPYIYDKYFKSFGDKVNGKYTPILEPLDAIHFNSTMDQDEPHGNISYVYAFTGIGIFIILLACINYMNLSTAKSATRATEIAMKKALGSGKRRLVISFLSESVFLSFISLLLAVALVVFLLKGTSFNSLIEKNLSLDFLSNPWLIIGVMGLTFVIGIISGVYPALYLPGLPISALKGGFKNRKSSHVLRKVLITTQFAISIFVVVCTLMMRHQIDYVRNKDLGYNKENLVVLNIQDSAVRQQIGAIKNDFLQNAAIIDATTTYHLMGMEMAGSVMWIEGSTGMTQQGFNMMYVGDDFVKAMGIELLAGRDFRSGLKEDRNQNTFLINEAGVKKMGWTDDPIGKKVKYYHDTIDGQIVGVVKNFNFKSLHNNIEPLLITKSEVDDGFLVLRVKSDHLTETMSLIQTKWTHYDPNHPFEYFFLDEKFNAQYKADEVQNKLLANLSYVCIFISLLGLLGLSAFNATQRTKEIGVRKVLGANIPGLIVLLSKEVLLLVVVAAILVTPLAIWMIARGVENFAYQAAPEYVVIPIVAVIALLAVFFTVAFQSLKTARANPVDSLKYE